MKNIKGSVRDIRELLYHVSSAPDGARLVRYAAEKGFGFEMDSDGLLPQGTGAAAVAVNGAAGMAGRVVLVNPAAPLPAQVSRLGRALRDLWSESEFPLPPPTKALPGPLLAMARKRILDGASAVFHARLDAEIEAATGLAMPGSFENPRLHCLTLFRIFQESSAAKAGDRRAVHDSAWILREAIEGGESPRLLTEFNALGDLRRAACLGLAPESPRYVPARDTQELAEDVLKHAEPEVKSLARTLAP